MPLSQYVSPFPALHLSIDEREMLIRTANDLVNQAQDKYEWFLWQERERLDPDRWQFVRTRDDMTVYVDRPLAEAKDNRNIQLLLTVGSIPGTLHDAMYGAINHTTDAMRLRTAYVQDTLLDGAVLETILEPTPELPFQSLTLKWFVKGMPLHVRAMNKKHGDSVSIEATGMRQLHGGEQIGFQLVHSVILAETPALPQYDRCNVSACMFWRQISPQCVQVYMTSYVEIPESLVTMFQLKSIGETLASESKTAHCAQMKKLAWFLDQRAKKRDVDEKGSSKACCSACGSKCPSVSPCTACLKPTCMACRERHELFAIGADRKLIKTKVRVCHPCMKTVEQLDGAFVAQQDMLEREQDERAGLEAGFDRETRSSTASSVSSTLSTRSSSM